MLLLPVVCQLNQPKATGLFSGGDLADQSIGINKNARKIKSDSKTAFYSE